MKRYAVFLFLFVVIALWPGLVVSGCFGGGPPIWGMWGGRDAGRVGPRGVGGGGLGLEK